MENILPSNAVPMGQSCQTLRKDILPSFSCFFGSTKAPPPKKGPLWKYGKQLPCTRSADSVYVESSFMTLLCWAQTLVPVGVKSWSRRHLGPSCFAHERYSALWRPEHRRQSSLHVKSDPLHRSFILTKGHPLPNKFVTCLKFICPRCEM
jgi:hypothetical protein